MEHKGGCYYSKNNSICCHIIEESRSPYIKFENTLNHPIYIQVRHNQLFLWSNDIDINLKELPKPIGIRIETLLIFLIIWMINHISVKNWAKNWTKNKNELNRDDTLYTISIRPRCIASIDESPESFGSLPIRRSDWKWSYNASHW